MQAPHTSGSKRKEGVGVKGQLAGTAHNLGCGVRESRSMATHLFCTIDSCQDHICSVAGVGCITVKGHVAGCDALQMLTAECMGSYVHLRGKVAAVWAPATGVCEEGEVCVLVGVHRAL